MKGDVLVDGSLVVVVEVALETWQWCVFEELMESEGWEIGSSRARHEWKESWCIML
jgi:hypothetical protein